MEDLQESSTEWSTTLYQHSQVLGTVCKEPCLNMCYNHRMKLFTEIIDYTPWTKMSFPQQDFHLVTGQNLQTLLPFGGK